MPTLHPLLVSLHPNSLKTMRPIRSRCTCQSSPFFTPGSLSSPCSQCRPTSPHKIHPIFSCLHKKITPEVLCPLTYHNSQNINRLKGAWVAQSVKRPTSAQVMTYWSVGSSPTWGSVLTAQRPGPTSDAASPSLSAPPPLTLCFSLSLLKLNKR